MPPAEVVYQRDLSRLNNQALALVLARWRRVRRGAISESWLSFLPEVAAIVVAAQTVAAEMADPYLSEMVGDGPRVGVEEFAGPTADGGLLASLLYLPVISAKEHIAVGEPPVRALREAEAFVSLYARTEVADAGRTAVSAGVAARPRVAGYYRQLNPPSCPRCVVLAGKFFRWNAGFQRHPRCDCTHVPVRQAGDGAAFDPRKAVEQGLVRGLSRADTRAIVEFGADPSQVINAHRGMYTAGGRRFTTEGTTRRGVAGARILARDVERTLRGQATGQTFRNLTFDRQQAAEYADLFRRGRAFSRQTRRGRTQTYAYRFTATGRPTVDQILRDATSREDAIRALINFGYVL